MTEQKSGDDVDLSALVSWSLLRKSASGDDLTALQSSTTSTVSSAGISQNDDLSTLSATSAPLSALGRRPHPTPCPVTE